MSEYPFLGNNIEIRKKEDNSGEVRFEIHVDPRLHTVLLEEGKWKDDGSRKVLKYKTTAGGQVIGLPPIDTPCT